MTNSKPQTFISLYDSPLDGCRSLFRAEGLVESQTIEDADIIVFNGGTDIGCDLYDETAVFTHSQKASQRDKHEKHIFETFPDKLKVGVCRGAQLLNVLNGGKLWQDVNNHGRSHVMLDVRSGEKVMVTSTHHQMMRPNYDTGVIIGVSDESTVKRSEHEHWQATGGVFFPDDHKDTEIVWYPQTRSLCVQGHPEYVPGTHFAEYFFRLVSSCMNEVSLCVD